MKKLVLTAVLFVALSLSLAAQTEGYLFQMYSTPQGGYLDEVSNRPIDTIELRFSLLEKLYKEQVCNFWYTKYNLTPVGPLGDLRVIYRSGNTALVPYKDAIRRIVQDEICGYELNGGSTPFGEDACYWFVYPVIFNGERITLHIYVYFFHGTNFDNKIKWAAFKGEIPPEVLANPLDYMYE